MLDTLRRSSRRRFAPNGAACRAGRVPTIEALERRALLAVTTKDYGRLRFAAANGFVEAADRDLSAEGVIVEIGDVPTGAEAFLPLVQADLTGSLGNVGGGTVAEFRQDVLPPVDATYTYTSKPTVGSGPGQVPASAMALILGVNWSDSAAGVSFDQRPTFRVQRVRNGQTVTFNEDQFTANGISLIGDSKFNGPTNRVLAEDDWSVTSPADGSTRIIVGPQSVPVVDIGRVRRLLRPVDAGRVIAGGAVDLALTLAPAAAAGKTWQFTLEPGSAAGASVDPATGRFTWTAPTTPGRYAFAIRVRDPYATLQTEVTSFVATVEPPAVAEATTTRLEVAPNPATVGDTLTFVAFVSPASGSGTPTGSVVFTLDGVALPPVLLVAAEGGARAVSMTIANGAGNHRVGVAYLGDARFAPSASAAAESLIVVAAPMLATPSATRTSVLAAPHPSGHGRSFVFTALVAATVGAPPPTGLVSFAVDGVPLATLPLVPNGLGGYVTLTVALDGPTPGRHAVTATYLGDAGHLASGSEVVGFDAIPATPDGPLAVELIRIGMAGRSSTLQIAFDRPLDPASAINPANYRFVGPRGREVAIVSVAYDPASRSITLRLLRRLRTRGRYTLTIVGGPGGLLDLQGRPTDALRPAGLDIVAGSGRLRAQFGRSTTRFRATLPRSRRIPVRRTAEGVAVPPRLAGLHEPGSSASISLASRAEIGFAGAATIRGPIGPLAARRRACRPD